MSAELRDVQYLVLPDADNPYLLARVRWPDVCQAISPVRPYWQDDPGLFDLPYDASSTPVTFEQAKAIAAAWDARLPSAGAGPVSGPSLVRRMPADWSNLSRAEQRAWSIDGLTTDDDRAPVAQNGHVRRGARSRRRRRAWVTWRRTNGHAHHAEVGPRDDAVVIDLTAMTDDTPGRVDPS
jgi:hypothetical protein